MKTRKFYLPFIKDFLKKRNKPTKTNFLAPYPFVFFINYFSLEVSGLPGCYSVAD